MEGAAAYVRSLSPGLPRSVQTLQLGGLANSFGNGLAYPFLFIYLHNVRGMSLGLAGLIVGANSTIGLFAGPAAGPLVDRFGGRRVLALALGLQSVGYGAYPLVHHPWQGFAASTVAGVGNASFWPAQSSLIAGLMPSDRRHKAFAVQRVTMNLGIGLGAMIGGFVATTSEPRTFTFLFLGDALTFVLYFGVLLLVPSPPRADSLARRELGGYGTVLRNRVFLGVLGINLLLTTAGIAMFELFPAYAKNHAGVDERGIGWIYLANTLTIVLIQLPVARLLEGRRRMPATAALAVLWAVSWACVPGVSALASGASAAILFVVVLTAFAVGECVHGGIWGALVTDLADDRLIGRYMAMSALSWTAGFAAGPAIGGFVLAASPTGLWLGAAVVLLGAAGCALGLERALPPVVRRTPRRASEGLVEAGVQAGLSG